MSSRVTQRRAFLKLIGASAVAATAGCMGGGDADGGGGEETTIEEAAVTLAPDGDTHIEPAELEIPPNAEVTFEWDSSGHNIEVESKPDDSDWDGVTSIQLSGHTHTHTFEVEGRYEYHCVEHRRSGEEGVIIVGDG